MSIGNQNFGIPRKYQNQIGIWYFCPKFLGIFLVLYRHFESALIKIWLKFGIFRQKKSVWYLVSVVAIVVSWPGPARGPAGPCAGSGRARGRHECAGPCGARAHCVWAARRQFWLGPRPRPDVCATPSTNIYLHQLSAVYVPEPDTTPDDELFELRKRGTNVKVLNERCKAKVR